MHANLKAAPNWSLKRNDDSDNLDNSVFCDRSNWFNKDDEFSFGKQTNNAKQKNALYNNSELKADMKRCKLEKTASIFFYYRTLNKNVFARCMSWLISFASAYSSCEEIIASENYKIKNFLLIVRFEPPPFKAATRSDTN